MTDEEHQKLEARFWELERLIQDIHAAKVVDGNPAELEASCLKERDEIEFLLGEEYLKRRASEEE